MTTITVSKNAAPKSYSRMIFGGFLEHFGTQIYGGVFDPSSPLADDKGFRMDTLEALKELNVPVVRWPGGCYASGYHWEDGVGENREPGDDMAWGVVEPHTFGTDEFIELCRRLDWEPYICNNAGNGTVAEMRSWVEYCNAGGKRVDLWSIGNENWGSHEIGYKSIDEWAPLTLEAAKEMKAADPTIQLSVAARPTREWTLPLLAMTGEYLDFISIHSYWLGLWQKNDMPDYMSCIMKSEGPQKTLADYVGVLEEAGYRGRVKIAYDEWNLRGWHHPGFPRTSVQDYDDSEVASLVAARRENLIASQYTMADALFSASFFNACLRHAEDVGMANIAPLVNTRGPLHAHPGGVVRRTHFHTMAMYSNLIGSRIVDADVRSEDLTHGEDSIAVVDAIATVDEAGSSWSIAVVNRHPAADATCTVTLRDLAPHGTYEATVLSGDGVDSFNDIEHPNRVVPKQTRMAFERGVGKFPPHSLTIVKIPAV
jgi:alpha-L-arabinofuranosidase